MEEVEDSIGKTENGESSESENGLRYESVRMEEQRADASPAPMIPLTIGSDLLFLDLGGFEIPGFGSK